MIEAFLFYTFAGLMIGSALAVILARHPIYAVLSLVVTLCAMAALFVLLGAFFVAAVQVLVYAGAIMVLFLFVVMLLDLSPETAARARGVLWLLGIAMAGLFLTKLTAALHSLASSPVAHAASRPLGTTASIGTLLFTTYWLPFELASALILVGIVGAVVLAKRNLG